MTDTSSSRDEEIPTPRLLNLELKGEDIWLHVNPKGSVKASINLGHRPPDNIFHRALGLALNQQQNTPSIERLVDEIVDTKTELIRLSAERDQLSQRVIKWQEKSVPESIELRELKIAYGSLRATLAERDKELAEVKAWRNEAKGKLIECGKTQGDLCAQLLAAQTVNAKMREAPDPTLLDEVVKVLEKVINCARPNQRDNPSMFIVWQQAEQLLSRLHQSTRENRGEGMKYDYRETKEGKRRFKYKRFYRLTVLWQTLLWKLGIPWHNTFSDECTPDFNCCAKGLAVGPNNCPVCSGHEVESNTPRTTYTCGSSDYDQRPGTFKRGRYCYTYVIPPDPSETEREGL